MKMIVDIARLCKKDFRVSLFFVLRRFSELSYRFSNALDEFGDLSSAKKENKYKGNDD
jgi:hypothetical protein